MTDKEIIKAFECCTLKRVRRCLECPIGFGVGVDFKWCNDKMLESVLDLIKRQQAEIERLQEIANPKCQQCVEQTRKNSIIEFADELKRRMNEWIYDFQYNSEYFAAKKEVDNLVKELKEGESK